MDARGVRQPAQRPVQLAAHHVRAVVHRLARVVKVVARLARHVRGA